MREKGIKNLVNMLGFNYRMTEIEAAIGSERCVVWRVGQAEVQIEERLRSLGEQYARDPGLRIRGQEVDRAGLKAKWQAGWRRKAR